MKLNWKKTADSKFSWQGVFEPGKQICKVFLSVHTGFLTKLTWLKTTLTQSGVQGLPELLPNNYLRMRGENVEEEAKNYFKREGFRRVLQGFKDRYHSLGRVGGSVTILHPTEQERDDLEGFLQVNCHKQKSLTIASKRFEKALVTSKFRNLTLYDLLVLIYGNTLVSKKEESQRKEDAQNQRFARLLNQYETTVAGQWLGYLLETKNPPFVKFKQWEEEEGEEFEEQVSLLLSAINQLPRWEGRYQRLAVFAANVCKDPHAFDEKRGLFYYLCYGISYVLALPYRVKTIEEKNELLFKAGLLRDEISNYVTCYGVTGRKLDGTEHEGMEMYCSLHEVQQLTLANLVRLKAAVPRKSRVFVVENPAVFQHIIDLEEFRQETIVCGNGQLRMAVWVLLDFLVKEGACIWYAGDFDPEGLVIAQKVVERYPEHTFFWHYEMETFERAARQTKSLTLARIEKMKSLSHPVLTDIARRIEEEGKVGYQESILDLLVDIRNIK